MKIFIKEAIRDDIKEINSLLTESVEIKGVFLSIKNPVVRFGFIIR